jgi:hypothetical protein
MKNYPLKCGRILALLLLTAFQIAQAQHKTLNIPAIHQLVEESKSEHTQQVDAMNRQGIAVANEHSNYTLLAKLKTTYRKLQQHYNTLGTAIDAAIIGTTATPMVERIISNQAQIISLVQKNPALIAIGYQSSLQFAEQARDLADYIVGLTLAIGDVNQMKASDRKLLFDFALSELSAIQNLSGNMLSMMQYSKLSDLLKAANPFQSFIDVDQDLARDILRNAKYLKQ